MQLFLEKTLFRLQVSAFQNSGAEISTAQSELDSGEVSTLTTSMGYIAQHAEIAEMLNRLKAMVEKDANDLRSLQASVEQMDLSVGDQVRSAGNGG